MARCNINERTRAIKLDRRQFLRMIGLGAFAGSVANIGLANAGPEGGAQPMAMKFELPPLPYAYDALEPYYDKETVTLHHDKHHAAYVTGLNAAMDQVDGMVKSGDFAGAKAAAKAQAFHGSGHLLHSLFWTNMKPGGGGEPTGALANAIKGQFGSYDTFKKLFIATANATEGSGWAILGRCPQTGVLAVLQAEKHENFAVWGIAPILVLDVWEHAYYLKYQNRRPDWTAAFMDHLVNWDDVAERYAAARK